MRVNLTSITKIILKNKRKFICRTLMHKKFILLFEKEEWYDVGKLTYNGIKMLFIKVFMQM